MGIPDEFRGIKKIARTADARAAWPELVLIAAACLLGSPACIAADVGRVLFAAGEVSVVSGDGATRPLRKDEPVSEKDTLQTAAGATLQVKLDNGGFLLVRPESKLRVDQFRPGAAGAEPEAVVFLEQGAMRLSHPAVKPARDHSVQINSPLASVVVRGGDFECLSVPAKSPADAAQLSPGVYLKTLSGAASLTQGKNVVDVRPGQTWHVLNASASPSLLAGNADFQPRSNPALSPQQGANPEQAWGRAVSVNLPSAATAPATAPVGAALPSAGSVAPVPGMMTPPQQMSTDRINQMANKMPALVSPPITIQSVPGTVGVIPLPLRVVPGPAGSR